MATDHLNDLEVTLDTLKQLTAAVHDLKAATESSKRLHKSKKRCVLLWLFSNRTWRGLSLILTRQGTQKAIQLWAEEKRTRELAHGQTNWENTVQK